MWKRYSQFADLDTVLRKKWVEMSVVAFPPKKVFGAMDPVFLDKRLGLLSAYIQELLKIDNIADFHKPHISSNELRHFMNFDKGSKPKQKQAAPAAAARGERRSSVKKGRSAKGSSSRTARAGRRRSSVASRSKKKDPYASATNYVTDDASSSSAVAACLLYTSPSPRDRG